MIKSKAKGSAFERLVSNSLSTMFNYGNIESEKIFWRTINSGGFSKNKKMSTQDADITTIRPHQDAELFVKKFYIELKFYKSINIFALFSGSKCKLTEWIDKIKIDNTLNKNFLLIFKQNNKKIILLTTKDVNDNYFKPLNFQYNMKLLIRNEYYYLYKFEDFLKLNIDEFMDIIKDNNNESK